MVGRGCAEIEREDMHEGGVVERKEGEREEGC